MVHTLQCIICQKLVQYDKFKFNCCESDKKHLICDSCQCELMADFWKNYQIQFFFQFCFLCIPFMAQNTRFQKMIKDKCNNTVCTENLYDNFKDFLVQQTFPSVGRKYCSKCSYKCTKCDSEMCERFSLTKQTKKYCKNCLKIITTIFKNDVQNEIEKHIYFMQVHKCLIIDCEILTAPSKRFCDKHVNICCKKCFRNIRDKDANGLCLKCFPNCLKCTKELNNFHGICFECDKCFSKNGDENICNLCKDTKCPVCNLNKYTNLNEKLEMCSKCFDYKRLNLLNQLYFVYEQKCTNCKINWRDFRSEFCFECLKTCLICKNYFPYSKNLNPENNLDDHLFFEKFCGKCLTEYQHHEISIYDYTNDLVKKCKNCGIFTNKFCLCFSEFNYNNIIID